MRSLSVELCVREARSCRNDTRRALAAALRGGAENCRTDSRICGPLALPGRRHAMAPRAVLMLGECTRARAGRIDRKRVQGHDSAS